MWNLLRDTLYWRDWIWYRIAALAIKSATTWVDSAPEDMQFELIHEPLNTLTRMKVRALGTELGMPGHRVAPAIPGPGTLLSVSWEKSRRKAWNSSRIGRHPSWRNRKARCDIWQYFTVNTGVRSVGVMEMAVLTTTPLLSVLSLRSIVWQLTSR